MTRASESPTPAPFVAAAGAGLIGEMWAPVLTEAIGEHAMFSADLARPGNVADASNEDGANVWTQLITAVVDTCRVAEQSHGISPVGIGHSAGATAFMLAEQTHPGLFRELLLFEPALRLDDDDVSRRTAFADTVEARTYRFATLDEARAYLGTRSPVRTFSTMAADAFFHYGFCQEPDGGYVPRWHPRWEAALYRSAHEVKDLWAPEAIGCHVVVFYGDAPGMSSLSDEAPKIVSALPNAIGVMCAGLGHFGPFAEPTRFGSVLQCYLEGLGDHDV